MKLIYASILAIALCVMTTVVSYAQTQPPEYGQGSGVTSAQTLPHTGDGTIHITNNNLEDALFIVVVGGLLISFGVSFKRPTQNGQTR